MKKSKKGQAGLGVILIIIIVAIVGVILFQSIAQQVGETNRQVVVSTSAYTAPANGVRIDLAGQELLSTPVVRNATLVIAQAGNYTIDEVVSTTDGLKTVSYRTDSAYAAGAGTLNITYTYGDAGYIEDSGTRSIATLIVILTAIGIAVVMLVPTFRSGISGMFK